AADSARGADRSHRRAADAVPDRHHTQRHVAHGRGDDGRYRGLEQYPHRGVHQPPAARGAHSARSRLARLPRTLAAGAHDLACDAHRPYSHGAQARHRRGGLRAAGARHHRWAGGLGSADGVHCARCVLHGASWRTVGGCRMRPFWLLLVAGAWGARVFAQTTSEPRTPPPAAPAAAVPLTLAQAQAIALQNHPLIAAATYQEWQPEIRAVGTLRAARGADLALDVAGLVTVVNVKSGDEVKKGQLLLQLRDSED